VEAEEKNAKLGNLCLLVKEILQKVQKTAISNSIMSFPAPL
jgi:hypothetical protein